jgi:phage tail sheath gpL-like
MSISTAIGSERRSRMSAYRIGKYFDSVDSGNLAQVIIVLGEANTANQSGLSLLKREVTSANEAGQVYGYGSPIHQMMSILRPVSGDGVGGIPTIVIPQAPAGGASATAIVWTVTGTATANATHTFFISGRPYSFAVAIGDTPTAIGLKVQAAIAANLSAPVIATLNAGVITLTTKWKGATTANVNTTVSNGGNAAGLTYVQTSKTDGAGVVDLAPALAQFASNWYTIVINPYGEAQFTALEAFNGVPDDTLPTGRYAGTVFKPFVSFWGSTLADKAAIATITNDAARIAQVTHALAPAPNSAGMPWEAAANMSSLFARVAQDTPHLDVAGLSYPDMPIPADGLIGDMEDYNNRDYLVKKGASTVKLEHGAYEVQDLVTTYNPVGEVPLQYAYPRNLNIDWNVADGYRILEARNVKDHAIVPDAAVTNVAKVKKPKEWKADLFNYFDLLELKAIIYDKQFSKTTLLVEIDAVNRDRFNTRMRYRRTGFDRINSTDAQAGF